MRRALETRLFANTITYQPEFHVVLLSILRPLKHVADFIPFVERLRNTL